MTDSPLTLYLDEAGNTGDAVQKKDGPAFGDQPTFVLAAVAEHAGSGALGEIVAGLTRDHRIQADEIKGGQQIKRRPKLGLDLVERLLDGGHPVFAEVMDKRYYVVGNVVSFFLLSTVRRGDAGQGVVPGLAASFDPDVFWWRRGVADALADALRDDTLRAYSAAGVSGGADDLLTFTKGFARDVGAAFSQEPEGPRRERLEEAGLLGLGASMLFQKDMRQWLGSGRGEESDVVDRFLSPPDTSSGGHRIAMLPNVAAYNHVRGAVRAYTGADVEYVHDQHGAYQGVLGETDDLLTSGDLPPVRDLDPTLPFIAPTDYDLGGAAPVRFADSKAELGIQAADVLAALLRTYSDALWREGETPTPEVTAAVRLLTEAGPPAGVFPNLVATTQNVERWTNAPYEDE